MAVDDARGDQAARRGDALTGGGGGGRVTDVGDAPVGDADGFGPRHSGVESAHPGAGDE